MSGLVEQAAFDLLTEYSRQGANYSIRSTIGPVVATDNAINLNQVVRSVLISMREPTDAMCEASKSRDDSPSEIWQAMIDAALAEQPA